MRNTKGLRIGCTLCEMAGRQFINAPILIATRGSYQILSDLTHPCLASLGPYQPSNVYPQFISASDAINIRKLEEMSSTTILPMDSSLGSLASPRRSKASSEITRSLKHARDLFLERRLSEAFSTIKPLVTETRSEATPEEEQEEANKSAPVASASRSSRVKVWSLYITLLNAVADLGPEEGKDAFGSKEWKSLVAKLKDGTVWEDVVNIGYGGFDGNVDTDVVINL